MARTNGTRQDFDWTENVGHVRLGRNMKARMTLDYLIVESFSSDKKA